MKSRNLAAMILGAASLLGPAQASAEEKPVSVVADVIASEAEGASLIRPNIFYRLFGTDAYTFIEMYSDDKNYFGKTILGKELGSGFSATGEYAFGSDTTNRAGLGVKYSLPLPKGKLSVKLFPVWFSRDGYDKHRVHAGYSGSVDLPAGFEVSSFGECNLAAANGPQWGYGEVFAGKKLGKHVGVYGGALLRDRSTDKENKLVPGIELAGRLSYFF